MILRLHFFVTGNGFSTLSVEIYSMARAGISLTVNAISGFVFFTTILVVIGFYLVTNRAKRVSVSEEVQR